MTSADAHQIIITFWATFAGASIGVIISWFVLGILDRWMK